MDVREDNAPRRSALTSPSIGGGDGVQNGGEALEGAGQNASTAPAATEATAAAKGSSHYIVPIGFAPVCPGIYRSLYPTHKSYSFLDSLDLRTAICIDGNAARSDLLQYFCGRGIACLGVETGTNQEPFLAMSDAAVAEVITTSADAKNQPCLIFSVVDKVKLSAVIGCLRKAQGWGYSAILQEIEHFTDNHECMHNIMYVEAFNPAVKVA